MIGATGAAGVIQGVIQQEQALCSGIPTADVQALVTFPVSAAQPGGPVGCEFDLPGEPVGGDAIGVLIDTQDADGHSYGTLVAGAGVIPLDSKLDGVGDEAAWAQIAGGAPTVVAHQGNLTCSITPPPPDDVSVLTLPHQGPGPIYQIDPSDAQACAVKMGAICNDVFAAAG